MKNTEIGNKTANIKQQFIHYGNGNRSKKSKHHKKMILLSALH